MDICVWRLILHDLYVKSNEPFSELGEIMNKTAQIYKLCLYLFIYILYLARFYLIAYI